MRVVHIPRYGDPPELCSVPRPRPGPGEVLVRIRACGLNFADLLTIEGKYQERPDPPVILGKELCGIVEALGGGVAAPAVGTRVAIYAGQGGLAEYGCFPAERCIAVPEGMADDVAAGFLIAYGTSHVALARRAGLRAGETLLVTGAAGGVGLTAVEIGKAMGARVVAQARGADRLKVAKAAGADAVIGADEDLTEALRSLGRADVVYDTVGGDAFRAALRAVRPEARMLAIGFASGEVPQVPANILMVKNVSVIGVNWGGYLTFAPDVLHGSLRTLFGWWAEGQLHPHIGHRLPLERAIEGLDLLRSRQATGKVVIEIGRE